MAGGSSRSAFWSQLSAGGSASTAKAFISPSCIALNGASFGGIVGVPLLVAAIGHFGFSGAMIAAAVVMLGLMIPVILLLVGPPPGTGGLAAEQAAADAPSASQVRALTFRDVAFETVSIAFALVLFAQ